LYFAKDVNLLAPMERLALERSGRLEARAGIAFVENTQALRFK